jgi:aspartyl-tRNA synthetase
LSLTEELVDYPKASATIDDVEVGQVITIQGFLSSRRSQHAKLCFADVTAPGQPKVQLTAAWEREASTEHIVLLALKNFTLHSPVSVTGRVLSVNPDRATDGRPTDNNRVEIQLLGIQGLNLFPREIVISKHVRFPPEKRNLQIRFSQALRNRLEFRDYINRKAREKLMALKFNEYETPLLFKSTPEGAREFLVPSRWYHHAYALPQSPQQYKQLLMASGVGNYYQFARCFRDEDLRADRQPEFTQLDLEMPFATGDDVMRTVEALIQSIYQDIRADWFLGLDGTDICPWKFGSKGVSQPREFPDIDPIIQRMPYHEAMTRYGSDKPDLRIQNEVSQYPTSIAEYFTNYGRSTALIT